MCLRALRVEQMNLQLAQQEQLLQQLQQQPAQTGQQLQQFQASSGTAYTDAVKAELEAAISDLSDKVSGQGESEGRARGERSEDLAFGY